MNDEADEQGGEPPTPLQKRVQIQDFSATLASGVDAPLDHSLLKTLGLEDLAEFLEEPSHPEHRKRIVPDPINDLPTRGPSPPAVSNTAPNGPPRPSNSPTPPKYPKTAPNMPSRPTSSTPASTLTTTTPTAPTTSLGSSFWNSFGIFVRDESASSQPEYASNGKNNTMDGMPNNTDAPKLDRNAVSVLPETDEKIENADTDTRDGLYIVSRRRISQSNSETTTTNPDKLEANTAGPIALENLGEKITSPFSLIPQAFSSPIMKPRKWSIRGDLGIATDEPGQAKEGQPEEMGQKITYGRRQTLRQISGKSPVQPTRDAQAVNPNLRVLITGHSLITDKTDKYTVWLPEFHYLTEQAFYIEVKEVKDKGRNDTWTVIRRFSDFRTLLHVPLKNNPGINLPSFPHRTFLVNQQFDTQVLEQRKAGLQTYLNHFLEPPLSSYEAAQSLLRRFLNPTHLPMAISLRGPNTTRGDLVVKVKAIDGRVFLDKGHYYCALYKHIFFIFTTSQSSSPIASHDLRNCTVLRMQMKKPKPVDTEQSNFPLLSYPSAPTVSGLTPFGSSFASLVVSTTSGYILFIQDAGDGSVWYENLRKVRVASDPMNDLYVERLVRKQTTIEADPRMKYRNKFRLLTENLDKGNIRVSTEDKYYRDQVVQEPESISFEPDLATNIIINESGGIKAATVSKLIEKICDPFIDIGIDDVKKVRSQETPICIPTPSSPPISPSTSPPLLPLSTSTQPTSPSTSPTRPPSSPLPPNSFSLPSRPLSSPVGTATNLPYSLLPTRPQSSPAPQISSYSPSPSSTSSSSGTTSPLHRSVLSIADREGDLIMSRRSTNTVIKDMQMEINSMFENYEQNSMIIAFMYTFNTFITPDKLLNTLIYLFVNPPFYKDRPNANSSEKSSIDSKQYRDYTNLVRARIIQVLAMWLKVHFYDFLENSELEHKLSEFIKNHLSEEGVASAGSKLLMDLIKTKIHNETLQSVGDQQSRQLQHKPKLQQTPPEVPQITQNLANSGKQLGQKRSYSLDSSDESAIPKRDLENGKTRSFEKSLSLPSLHLPASLLLATVISSKQDAEMSSETSPRETPIQPQKSPIPAMSQKTNPLFLPSPDILNSKLSTPTSDPDPRTSSPPSYPTSNPSPNPSPRSPTLSPRKLKSPKTSPPSSPRSKITKARFTRSPPHSPRAISPISSPRSTKSPALSPKMTGQTMGPLLSPGTTESPCEPDLEVPDGMVTLPTQMDEGPTPSPKFLCQPEPILPECPRFGYFDLIDLDPLEVARQLTISTFQFYKNIKLKEFLFCGWTKPDAIKFSPNILKFQDLFNKHSNWTKTYCVMPETATARAQVIVKFIDIAQNCIMLQNYNTAMGISAAVTSVAVQRLKQTWSLVPREQLDKLKIIENMFSPASGYKNFRNIMKNSEPPALPYLGIFQSDMMFLDSGNPDFLEPSVEFDKSSPGRKLVNFEKRVKESCVLRLIQKFQSEEYNLKSVPVIQKYLKYIKALSDDEIYETSLEREARKKK